jgi:hypothetical protein
MSAQPGQDADTDVLIEEMFVTCIEAEFWIAADMWLGAGIKCPHGNWRAESPSLAFSDALVRLHAQFMEAEHNDGSPGA